MAAPDKVRTENPEIEARRQEYNRAIRDVRLANLVLSFVQFKVDRSITVQHQGAKLVLSGEVANFAFNATTNACFSEVDWALTVKAGRRKYASCKASYHVAYDGFTEIREEVVRLVAENLAQPATYAYFRALYASLDWAGQIGSPQLPIIKFMPRLFGAAPKPITWSG